MIEMTVTIKGEESIYKQKFLVYEEFQFIDTDEVMKKYIDEALSNSKINPEEIRIRALLVIK